jgi:chromosome partitioning protein
MISHYTYQHHLLGITMSYVIALLQKKGGVTKTTTAINLLGALLEANHTAILCDMDREKPDSLYWAENGEEINKFVIPLFEDNPMKKIEELRKQYQFIIIDTPPQFEAAALKAAMMCDFAIIPCGAALIERKALEEAAACALMANRPYKFLASRVTKNTNATKELLAQLEETGTFFQTYITNSVAMTECQSKGAWVGSYAPSSNNHLQYRALIKELYKALGV